MKMTNADGGVTALVPTQSPVTFRDYNSCPRLMRSPDREIIAFDKQNGHEEIVSRSFYKALPRKGCVMSRCDVKKKIPLAAPRNLKKPMDAAQDLASGNLKLSVRKPDHVPRKVKRSVANDAADKSAEMYVSDDVLEHLTLQSCGNERNSFKKAPRLFGRGVSISSSPNKIVSGTKPARPAKRVLKQPIRRLCGNADLQSQVTRRSKSTGINNKEVAGNKADHNNWIIDANQTSNAHTSISIPNYHMKGRASSFNSFSPSNSLAKKELSFSQADSSDSGCFSNISIQSSTSPGVVEIERNLEGHSTSGKLATPSAGSKQGTGSSGLCSSCGDEPVGRGCDLCKNCASAAKVDGTHAGPFSELKAYAQSLAESVKKILSLSPGQDQTEVADQSVPSKGTEEKTSSVPHVEHVRGKSNPDVPLHRYMTEIHMMLPQQGRPKSLSFDGRVGSNSDERVRPSQMYWVGQDKFKVSGSFSKSSDSNSSFIDVDYFTSGKDGKQCQDGEKRKPKRKNSLKQLSRVERARTDGDLRANPQQQGGAKKVPKEEHKKGFEILRNRSKSLRISDAEYEEYAKRSQKISEEISVLKISRMKVIHEGSSVDPPYTLQRRKSDDGKGRRGFLTRSATAPYKNHVAKKDTSAGEKLGSVECAVRTNRSNTRLPIRTNKQSTLRKENSINDRKRPQECSDAQTEVWSEESSALSATTFIRRRSTSYDGSRSMHHQRGDLLRSISWSAIEGDDENVIQRREAVSVSKVSTQPEMGREDGFSMKVMLPSKFALRGKKGQAGNVIQNDHFLKKDLSADNFRYNSRESSDNALSYNKPTNEMISSDLEELVELRNAQHKSSYFDGVKYYGHGVEKRLSPCVEEDSLEKDESSTAVDSESYYCYTDPPEIDGQLQWEVMKVEANKDGEVLKNAEDENIYQDQIKKYDKPGQWYAPESCSDERALVQRDRSHESKSSTSFHVVTTVISSHSDETLKKYSGFWDHLPVRKQSAYTETDVDTGIIYHLAKRQMTRALVPNYHDLTRASKDIYTMSGDVSTSASSNSAISTKSEISESVYTGGFYKDPFYNHDSKSSSSSNSSTESSNHIYFEPKDSSKQEHSELDIYTGGIFCSSKNALILETAASSQSSHAFKYGSTNNSARPTFGRMPRRHRCRSRIDAIKVGGAEPVYEFSYTTIVPHGDSWLCNFSNNSNNWCGMDDFEGSANQSTIVTKSKEPMYTYYIPGDRPEFNVKAVEKSNYIFDFLKYDTPEETCTPGLFPSPSKNSISSDNIWYTGLYGQVTEVPEKIRPIPERSPAKSMFSWQYHDDYYMSTVRPRINKTNNCNSSFQSHSASNTNNNHFEDLYTGAYGAQNVQNYVHEQANNIRQPQADNWYVQQPSRPAASNFYEDEYSFAGSPRKPPSAMYESAKNISSSFFGHGATESRAPNFHMGGAASNVYEHSYMPSAWNFAEPLVRRNASPERPEREERESYFRYGGNHGQRDSFYVIDNDTYSFEEKVVKPPSPVVAVIKEIKKVGGIVCRDNVANKEDYAEDVNRDLEPGAWAPFTFRREDEGKCPAEMGGARAKSEVPKISETACHRKGLRSGEDSPYAHGRLYDNTGARNKWREASKCDMEPLGGGESGQHRPGDSRNQDFAKPTAWNSPDQIPDRARGKHTSPKPTVVETSNSSSSAQNMSYRNPKIKTFKKNY